MLQLLLKTYIYLNPVCVWWQTLSDQILLGIWFQSCEGKTDFCSENSLLLKFGLK